MLRMTASLIHLPMQRSAPPRPVFKLLQVVIMSNRRWLAQRVQSGPGPTTALRMEENKHITPLGWLLLLIPATTFGLGCWQIKRKAWKEQLIKDLDNLAKQTAVPLPKNLADLEAMEYRLVQVRGQFIHDKEMYLGPRSLIHPDGVGHAGGLFSQRDAGNGYLVVTPFKLADKNETILINRGWVSRKQQNPETRLQGQYPKELELTCVVRKGENRPRFSPQHKGEIFLYRDLSRMCKQTGALPIFLDATFDSSVPGGPIGGQTRVTLHNDHVSYVVTWFGLSVATSFLWYRQIVKRKPF